MNDARPLGIGRRAARPARVTCLVAGAVAVLQLAGCGGASLETAAGRTPLSAEQATTPAPIGKEHPVRALGAPNSVNQATSEATASATRPASADETGGLAGPRYELRLLRGLATYKDPVRLHAVASAGYPSLTATAYRIDGDGRSYPLDPISACSSSVRCERRESPTNPQRAPEYALMVDAPSLATLKASEAGIEVAPASAAFPVDVAVTVTLTVGNLPPIARKVTYAARR